MHEQVSKLLREVPVPRMFPIEQCFPEARIDPADLPRIIGEAVAGQNLQERLRPGMRVAITAGSRGIDNIALIIRSIAELVRSAGAEPFVVPAMGSHAGATAQGQRELLEGLGVSEESVGCPILSSMETVLIGHTEDGREVYIDRHAAEADGIVVACRVKPHTAFRGRFESGVMKMMAIGLGKQYGAERCHDQGFGKMAENVVAFGRAVLNNAPILFAVAVLENAYDRTCRVEALAPEQIEQREPELLREAFSLMPRILVDSCDVLVVDEIGKNYSGGGMDPNITGTWVTPYGGGGLQSSRVAVLGVSQESHGNAHGIGMADATTRRAVRDIDYDAVYMNGITCNELGPGRLPYMMENDREAIQVCVATCSGVDRERIRLVRIPNSLHLRRIWLSEVYLEQAAAHPDIRILGDPAPMPFDREGYLIREELE